MPADFNITGMYHGEMETTFTFSWDTMPQGSGPETVVDNYTIYISTSPMSEPINTIMATSPPVTITLIHNVSYSVSITASNCAGESDNQTIPIKIGKY